MDEKYCYPNSNVLINKLGIRDFEKLKEKERSLTAVKALSIAINPVKGNFDLKHLQTIHKQIFSEIYDWAGKIRTVDIAKKNLFCRVQFLDNYAKTIFDDLKQDNFLIGMEKTQAIKKLAQYMGDINALHPFREGNGRTQRQFITYLAKATGLNLDMQKVNIDDMLKASIESFSGNYNEFEKIFTEIASPITLEEQEQFLKIISKEAYKKFDNLKQKNLIPDRSTEFIKIQEKNKDLRKTTMDMTSWKNAVNNSSKNEKSLLKQKEKTVDEKSL